MQTGSRVALFSLTLLVSILGLVACDTTHSLISTPHTVNHLLYSTTFTYSDDLYCFLKLKNGVWEWSWRILQPDSQQISGVAQLTLKGRKGTWRLDYQSKPPAEVFTKPGLLLLYPLHDQIWHTLEVPWPLEVPTTLLPLPRQPIQSPYYADLLHLLQELTQPKFSQIVTHWPQLPVPVRPVEAVSGNVDLAACLGEAVEIWNLGETDSLFRWSPHADWGVRLVHFPGMILHPPLSIKIVRLDDSGQPLRVHIIAGDNYDQNQDRTYAVRGMVHELAHALWLWGHSQDRNHVLWGRAPPLVTHPSGDERLAARLLTLLPVGLGLSAYDRLSEMDPER